MKTEGHASAYNKQSNSSHKYETALFAAAISGRHALLIRSEPHAACFSNAVLTTTGPMNCTTIITGALWVILAERLSGQEGAGEIQIAIHEGKDARPVPCRLHIKNSAGQPVFAPGLPRWRDHFVCAGKVKLALAAGAYSYEIERGREYLQAAGSFNITNGAKGALEVRLHRLANLAAEGWWSGDLHVHRPVKDIELLM